MVNNSSPWGFSRYNVMVKQIEGCSDILAGVIGRLEPLLKSNPDETACHLMHYLREAMGDLDRYALQMLAHYDPAAKQMLIDGVKRDPRRNMFPDAGSAHDPEPKALPAPEKAPKRKALK